MHVNEGENFLIQRGWELLSLLLFSFFVRAIDQVTCQLFDRTDGWMDSEVRLNIPSIKVIACHTCPVVTNDDAIGINHWHNFEYDALP